MEALVLVGGFVVLALFGFRVMGRLDHFLNSGAVSPYWDREEERAAAPEEEAPAARGGGGAHARVS